MSAGKRVATGHLLDPKPQALTEQEVQYMDDLARIMYGIYARQQRQKPEKAAPRVSIHTPRVFAAVSTTPS
jgi:hypothetical protein